MTKPKATTKAKPEKLSLPDRLDKFLQKNPKTYFIAEEVPNPTNTTLRTLKDALDKLEKRGKACGRLRNKTVNGRKRKEFKTSKEIDLPKIILAFFKKRKGKSFSIKQVAQGIKIPSASVKGCMSYLVKKKLVRRSKPKGQSACTYCFGQLTVKHQNLYVKDAMLRAHLAPESVSMRNLTVAGNYISPPSEPAHKLKEKY